MAVMMGSLYEALIEGGTSADSAKKAAEEVADHQKQLSTIDGDLRLLKWMVGFNIAMTAAILAKQLV